MFNDHYDVQFCFISDDVAIVQWCHADSSSLVKDLSIFIVAMTTADSCSVM